MQKKEFIRTLHYKIDDGISATLAAHIMIKESNKAKDDGWREITMKIQTLPNRFTIELYGVK
jgi:hypothetical protein